MINGIEVFENIATLNPDQINQWQGRRRADDCCVGAHLANALNLPANATFLDGADAWAEKMGGNRAHAILMLKMAGAPDNPFGTDEWEVSPAEVYQNLLAIETLPDLRNADLSEAGLMGANLSGADLSAANLRGADLGDANLRGADLRGANLSYADLRGADLSCADLRDVDLSCAFLRGADWTGANLRGADLRGADWTGAHISKT